MYVLGKVYKVPTLVVSKAGKTKMKKIKYFNLQDEVGRDIETRIPKSERKFYKAFIALADKEGEIL